MKRLEAPSRDAAPLDIISAVMERPERPLDFAGVARIRNDAITHETLERGAASARNQFWVSGAVLRGRRWFRAPDRSPDIEEVTATTDEARREAIERFMMPSLDPSQTPPFLQCLVSGPGERNLVTRWHHAAADGLSAGMWLAHQLAVASERVEAVSETQESPQVALREHSAPVRKSAFAHRGRSSRLWCRDAPPARARRFRTITILADEYRPLVGKHETFTYNDLLATVTLDVFHRWNARHDAPVDRVALWCPVNIRAQPFAGFGNGSSRVRVYAKWAPSAELIERCRSVRQQMRWTKKHGEWFVPHQHPLLSLPDWLMAPVLRVYLGRPWVDMATGSFSHAERIGPESDRRILPDVDRIETIGGLHQWYPLSMSANTFAGTTSLSITYDPAQLEEADMDAFVTLYEHGLDEARRRLAR